MTHRAFKQAVRDRMERTGEKYTDARRAAEEIASAPPPEPYRETWGEAYYSIESYDHTPYGEYVDVLAYVDETDGTHEVLATSSGEGFDWATTEGRSSIAALILEHRLGEPPNQPTIDEFVMRIAAGWRDGWQPTVFGGQISSELGI